MKFKLKFLVFYHPKVGPRFLHFWPKMTQKGFTNLFLPNYVLFSLTLWLFFKQWQFSKLTISVICIRFIPIKLLILHLDFTSHVISFTISSRTELLHFYHKLNEYRALVLTTFSYMRSYIPKFSSRVFWINSATLIRPLFGGRALKQWTMHSEQNYKTFPARLLSSF